MCVCEEYTPHFSPEDKWFDNLKRIYVMKHLFFLKA